eukprot:1328346-Prorocentrum_lima.AAC.1
MDVEQDHLRQHSLLHPAPGKEPQPKTRVAAGHGEVHQGHNVMSPNCLLEADLLFQVKLYHPK